MKVESEKLKSLAVGGMRTKVVVLGIGKNVSEEKLRDIASAPVEENVILVPDCRCLSDVEEQLRNASCSAGLLRFHYSN